MRIWYFFKSPAGNVVLFVTLVAVGVFLIHRSNARELARSAQLTEADTGQVPTLRESILRAGVPLKVPASASRPAGSSEDARPAEAGDPLSRPHAAREGRQERQPAKPRVLPISLFTGTATSDASALSQTYAPFGRLIPCETVITIESSKLDTPVIGLVTEDVWHNGELVIPAGTEVHGKASLDRARERVAVSGKWVVVWRDGSPLNGTELVLNGIALDRAKDDVSGEFGMRDGSAGLLGTLVKTDDWQEIKLFASTFLAGMAGGLQDMQNQGTAFGGVVQVPLVSGRNAALSGTADVLNVYRFFSWRA